MSFGFKVSTKSVLLTLVVGAASAMTIDAGFRAFSAEAPRQGADRGGSGSDILSGADALAALLAGNDAALFGGEDDELAGNPSRFGSVRSVAMRGDGTAPLDTPPGAVLFDTPPEETDGEGSGYDLAAETIPPLGTGRSASAGSPLSSGGFAGDSDRAAHSPGAGFFSVPLTGSGGGGADPRQGDVAFQSLSRLAPPAAVPTPGGGADPARQGTSAGPDDTPLPAAVPLPAGLGLLVGAMVPLAALARRRRNRAG